MASPFAFGDQIIVFSHPEQIEVTVYEGRKNRFDIRFLQVRAGYQREILETRDEYPSFEVAVHKTGQILSNVVSRLPGLAKTESSPLRDFFHPDGTPLSKEEKFMDTGYLNTQMIRDTLRKLQESRGGTKVSVFIKQ